MFVGPASLEHSQHGDYSTTDHQHFDTLMTTDSQVPVGPSTCVFWCAVALGALVKGRPIESVRNGLQYYIPVVFSRQPSTIAVRATVIQFFHVVEGKNIASSIVPQYCMPFVSTSATHTAWTLRQVEKYSRLAREALANNPGPANAEVGR